MNLQEALQAIKEGKKVKLPEWSGYWFLDVNNDMISVLTKDGDILDTPWFDKYEDRTDFEITEGRLGFDWAIRALKNGKKVTRKGWNGKNMWLIYVPAEKWSTSIGPSGSLVPNAHRLPWIAMKTVNDGLVPWLASQTDMLAEDWELY